MKGQVLVVDDEPSIREACRKILTREGLSVEVAGDGLQAQKLLQLSGFDLVVIDLKLPGLSGEDLLQWLREHDPGIVPVIITGYPSFSGAVAAVKEGAYDYIPKPFTPGELRLVVQRGLERRWLAREMQRLRSEQERNLRLISQEKSKLQSVISSMTDGVMVVNSDSHVVLCNSAARQILGLNPDCVDKKISQVMTGGEVRELIASSLQLQEMVSFSREIRVRTADYLVNLSPVKDGAEILGIVVSFRDVTRMRELSDTKSAFVNMVSHEIRSPLAAVEGYLDIIRRGLITEPQQVEAAIDRAKVRLETLRQLTDDLLSLARMEHTRVKKELVCINVQELVRELLELYTDKAKEKQVQLHAAAGKTLPVFMDRNDLVLLITNLLDNAIKYNIPGGRVDISVSRRGTDICIKVRDSGVGIATEHLDDIFEEFYRVKNSTTRDITGTGLGLAIVNRIVKAYKGRIEVRSEEGKGTDFQVYLPLDNTGRGVGYE